MPGLGGLGPGYSGRTRLKPRVPFGDGLQVTAGYQFFYFLPIHFADVETKAYPAARTDVGGQVVFHRVRRHEDLVVAGEGFAADGNDAVAVMVVQEIGEDFFADAEAGVVSLQFPGGFGKGKADFRQFR